MNANDLVELNNEKRQMLSIENLKYYEDMLIYIRLSHNKSDQETEEILSELLDHLLAAQEEGRSAEEVFGNDPRGYANAIIGELPKMVTKERVNYFVMAILYFFAAAAISSFVFTLIGHYLFKIEPLTKEIFVGSFTLQTILSVPIAFLLLYSLIQFLRWTCFRKLNKGLEFLLYWLFGMASIGIFMVLIVITPDFGPTVEVPVYAVLLLGIVLYVVARMTRRMI